MNETFDMVTFIFLILAVVILMMLRNVLGKRTGYERPQQERTPLKRQDPSSIQRDPPSAPAADNVVMLPQKEVPAPSPVLAPENAALDTSSQSAVLASILANDRHFNPTHFIEGAKIAYEMIVTHFAQGDRKALRPLLSAEVFEGFDAAITARETQGQEMETRFVGIGKAEIVEASLKGAKAHLTVKFRSMLIQSTKDREGHIIAGDPTKVSEVIDIWTFARDIGAKDPNWRLVATEAA